MNGEAIKGKDLHYFNIYPDDYDEQKPYPLVVMLHGFGANMRDLAGLAPSINRTGYVYTCPNAPIPFQLGPGMAGYGWHPPRGESTAEDFQQAEDLVGSFFDEVFEQLGATPGNIALLGFSQGGGMTYRCGLNRPDTFAGLMALSASLPDPEILKTRLPEDRNQPIFIAHGRADPLVSMDSARVTMEFLEEQGYQPSYHEYDMGHEIPPTVLADLVPWLAQILPPLTPD